MDRYKYPRTPHLSWSPGATSDDKFILNMDGFVGREVVATIKKDGENSTLGRTYTHARSVDSRHHPSRDWLKTYWGTFNYKIPENMRICGENLYARHSIAYDDLESYFYGFSVWEKDRSLCWDETLMWFEELGITPVPTLYRGPFDLDKIRKLTEELDLTRQEGLVIRVADEIVYDEFEFKVAKFVRKGHVQTDEHWMLAEIVPNKLKEETP
jgi:hypothetical protein